MKMTDEQLIGGAGAGQGSTLEMMRRLKDSIEKLDISVNTFNKATSEQQNLMIGLAQQSGKQADRIYWLTWVIAILTVAMVVKMFWK